MNDLSKWLAGSCVIASLTVGTVAGVSGAGAEGTARATGSEVEAAHAEPVPAVEPEQAESIEALRRDRTSDDALPLQWRGALTQGDAADERWGANPHLSRRTAPGVWIVPGDDYVCVANSSPGEGALGFGCAANDDVKRGLLAPSDVDQNGNGVLTGVLPDGVETVTLADRDGSERTVSVKHNTYRAAIGPDLKEVRFTGPDGTRHVLPMGWDS